MLLGDTESGVIFDYGNVQGGGCLAFGWLASTLLAMERSGVRITVLPSICDSWDEASQRAAAQVGLKKGRSLVMRPALWFAVLLVIELLSCGRRGGRREPWLAPR